MFFEDDYWDINKLRDQLRFMKRYNHKFSSTILWVF